MGITSNLKLEATLEKDIVRLGEPCQIWIRLSSKGEKAQLVNRRMAIGYRDSVSREIFAEIIDFDTGKPARIDLADYNRDFSPVSDYVYLDPGQTISTSFDLLEWYPPVYEGTYKLVVYYQANEPLASAAPPNVVSGIYESNQLILVVLPK